MFKKEKTFSELKIVGRYLASYKSELIAISILGIFSAIANGTVPYLAGRLFDAILKPVEILIFDFKISLWLFFIIIWLIVRLISDLIDWIINSKSNRLENIVYADYIVKSFGVLLELPISFHRDRKMGEVVDRLNAAANWLSRLISDVLVNLAPQFLSVLASLIICFYVNYYLAAVLVFGVLIYALILIKVAPASANAQRKARRFSNRAFGDAYDAVFNAGPIKQAVAENYEKKKIFKNFRIRFAKFWTKVMALWDKMSFSQRLIVTLIQLAIFIISIYFILRGRMTIGELVMFNGYAAMFFAPFVRLGQNWTVVQNGLISIERAEKILTLPKEIYLPKNAVILSDIKGEVEFQNVSFAYKSGQPVLRDISFRVKSGEIIALVGESGVGKSTLVELISGYYFPQKGRVLIDGHNIKNLDLKFLRSKIAVVPQEIVLFNDTIKTNIKYGSFNVSDKKIEEAAKTSHCLKFIEEFPKKWNQVVGERGVKLSVGQKQRVAIARAILRNPKILILDEPTSALDANSEKIIQESLDNLMKGRTTFIVAHRLSTVQKADRILVLENGRIVEEGSHNDLIKIKNGVYRRFYELQKL